MTDLEEFESWHDELIAWERHHDELAKIKGGYYEVFIFRKE